MMNLNSHVAMALVLILEIDVTRYTTVLKAKTKKIVQVNFWLNNVLPSCDFVFEWNVNISDFCDIFKNSSVFSQWENTLKNCGIFTHQFLKNT